MTTSASGAPGTDATVFRPFVEKIGDGVPGATLVTSFVQGVAASLDRAAR